MRADILYSLWRESIFTACVQISHVQKESRNEKYRGRWLSSVFYFMVDGLVQYQHHSN